MSNFREAVELLKRLPKRYLKNAVKKLDAGLQAMDSSKSLMTYKDGNKY